MASEVEEEAAFSLYAVHCLHCRRIWIAGKNKGTASVECDACGKELYPVSHRLVAGED